MATNTAGGETIFDVDESADAVWETVKMVLRPIASLKLTVVLFALLIVLVFVGTLAQWEKDIWEVVHGYFRTTVAWVEFRALFPPSFFPGMDVPKRIDVGGHSIPFGFPFPGGWAIGIAMFINLLAAHTVRFKVQARGPRLIAGLAVIGIGIITTWFVIASGSNMGGLQEAPLLGWKTLWVLCQFGVLACFSGIVYAVIKLGSENLPLRIILAAAGAVLGFWLLWVLAKGDAARFDDSSMRILWQLIKGTLAGLVLLVGCIMAFKKRAGIVVIHSGVALIMFNELFVGTMAVEGQMTMDEGQSTNYVRDIRELELAIIDHSKPDEDFIVVVPESKLRSGDVIRHEKLPFDVELVRFFKNASRLRKVKKDDENPADAGIGTDWIVDELTASSGTDSSVDVAAAYVKFTSKADNTTSLGTYLLGLELSVRDFAETIPVSEAEYDVFLRFKRNYKPYSIELIDVRKDDYLGTDTPRNYSSEVRLVDDNVDREVKIWMNNPMRFKGETFYQSNYSRDATGVETTTLQVVSNRGWMIPYVACMVVWIGMMAHFSIVLLRFLKRRASPAPAVIGGKGAKQKTPELAAAGAGGRVWLIPVICVVICAGYLAGKVRTPAPGRDGMDLYAFGKLPVVYQGRAKPIDTLARNSLRIISNKQTFVDNNDKKQPAIRWFLDMITRSGGETYRVIRIDNLDVQSDLGLKRRKGFRYAIDEIDIRKLVELIADARKVEARDRTLRQAKLLELEKKIGVIRLLLQAYGVPQIRPDHGLEDFRRVMQEQQMLARRQPPLGVPVRGVTERSEDEDPVRGEEERSKDEEWETYVQAWINDVVAGIREEETNPATESLSKILTAYADQDAKAFNREVADYSKYLSEEPPDMTDPGKLSFEAFFNHFSPFVNAVVLYGIAFALVAVSWLVWTVPLNRAAFWLIVFTFLVHTVALGSRIYISGRPPVTNLYSSAVFIGWGAVVLGMILELVFRMGIGNIIATVAGFSTLLIAHFLAGDGDTFTVMQAVLDTQFWLATHVTCITLGYTTTYVAGLLGLVYIFRSLFGTLSAADRKDLTRMMYGTICFAIFFSFVGTVLGGLWADDSWGRFWGWDPKENGALIIVLWNALVLHARWGGMVRDRGLAVMAIGGNIVTSWSWFGVNELGVGLHNYGFTEGVLLALIVFASTQVAVMGLGIFGIRNSGPAGPSVGETPA